MQINAVTTYAVEGRVAVITTNNPPVSALSQAVREGLIAGMKQALADPAADAVVIACEGRTFYAGADISEIGKGLLLPTLPETQAVIEASGKPVIAALHGTTLGGGLETALVAHYRIAVPSTKLGLPEVNLGLLPGAGGTQRLPRIVGIAKALDMITGGAPIGAKEALAIGLVDELAGEATLRADAIALANRVLAEGRPLVKVRDKTDKLDEARANPGIFDEYRKANAKKFRGFHAPAAIIRCIEATLSNRSFDEALTYEREEFLKLKDDSQSAALRHLFFAERAAAKVDGLPADTPILPVNKAGVIGAGTMGGGIAMNFANAGIPVTVVEMTQAALDRGLGIIRKNYEATAAKGKLTAEGVEKAMGLITGALDMAALADADLIIEAVFEQLDIKQDVFRKLDAVAKPGAILATNTSYLDIDEIAKVTSRPEAVLGLHFFSPANVMKLLEVVRARATGPAQIATAMKLAKTIGKIGVLAGNGPGFIGNRILFARNTQADALILDGATPQQVDRVIVDFGFAMGHFQMRDLVGLDVGWNKATSASGSVRDILNEMGHHGQKTGHGYYDYDEKRNATPSPVAAQVIASFAAKQGVAQRAVSDEEISDRILYAMVNEGARILDAGIASRASDIDIVWITGYGWPKYRGGPMFWADLQGQPNVLAKLKALEAAHGEAFTPSPLIERLVAEGKSFNG
ncbi:MAG: enoyl-CoA hydratase/isomerase family protein [Sphingomonadales bacterium]|nr:enoyl-CoA hydratase/isomerase family protein [Sphingomonadales bacterium]